MAQSHILNTILEINLPQIQRRLIEVLPGLLSWGTLIGLSVLAFLIPYWIAIFIIVFDATSCSQFVPRRKQRNG